MFNFFLIFNSVATFVRSLITLVPFLNMYLCGRPSSSFGLRFYAVSLLSHGAPPKSLNLSFMKFYLISILYMLHLDRFQFSALLTLPSGKLLTLRLDAPLPDAKFHSLFSFLMFNGSLPPPCETPDLFRSVIL